MVAINDTVDITCVCPRCGAETIVSANRVDIENWVGGLVIQKALPYLTTDQREALKTGWCKDCVDYLMGSHD